MNYLISNFAYRLGLCFVFLAPWLLHKRWEPSVSRRLAYKNRAVLDTVSLIVYIETIATAKEIQNINLAVS